MHNASPVIGETLKNAFIEEVTLAVLDCLKVILSAVNSICLVTFVSLYQYQL